MAERALMNTVILGLDLGQKSDPTALAGLEQYPVSGVNHYNLRILERWPLQTPYPQIVADVCALLTRPQLHQACLAVDQTGVGRPVVDMFVADPRLTVPLYPITITAGHHVKQEPDGYHVPKKDLVGVLTVLFEQDRLRVDKKLPQAAMLVKELDNFRVKITAAANETFAAWREGQHDDLVLAVAIAAWVGEDTSAGWDGSVGLGPKNLVSAAPGGVFLPWAPADDDDRTRPARTPSAGLEFPRC